MDDFLERSKNHPGVLLMKEDVQERALLFGEIFNLWPSQGTTNRDYAERGWWRKELIAATTATDGTPIPLDAVFAIWTDIAGSFLTVSSPKSVVRTTRGEWAKRSKRGSI